MIEKLSLNVCQSLELVLFDLGFDLNPWGYWIHKSDRTLLHYLTYTDEIFGLGQELDSIEKWDTYESKMNVLRSPVLRNIKSMGIKFDPLTVASIL